MTQPALQAITRPLEVLKKTQKNDGEINWVTASFMGLFHIGALAALFFFSWKAFLVAAFLWWVATSLGIGMCYHRLLTHRGYKVPRWLEYVLTVCATLALEGGPIFWVATHRIHHKYSDQEGDPHSPVDGTWWSHMGWILTGKSMHHDTTTLARYVRGIPFVLWGIFLRTVIGLHFTWLVNSATHSIGTRRFKTRDLSTNSWWVALVTWGEGWHNNHHAHPVSARHGLTWYEVDFNWYVIWFLEKIRIAQKVHTAKISELKRTNESIVGRTLTPEVQRELASVEL
jgi:fatty-acid desaturase